MQGKEIERKFLAGDISERISGIAGSPIRQGYVAREGSTVVRLREKAGIGFLTVKSGSGLVRREEEIVLDGTDFDALWPFTEGWRLEKTRYKVALDAKLTAEVDVFSGSLAGLVLVEVEFSEESAARAFQPPDWFGTEVTEDLRYTNSHLARSGRPAEETV